MQTIGGECPWCAESLRAKKQEAIAEVKATYGVVSADKYLIALRKAENLPEEPPEETLREDYCIGIDGSGVFSVGYTGRCNQCGFEFSYDHTESCNPRKIR